MARASERETFDEYMTMCMCVHTSTRVGTWPLLVPSVGRGWHWHGTCKTKRDQGSLSKCDMTLSHEYGLTVHCGQSPIDTSTSCRYERGTVGTWISFELGKSFLSCSYGVSLRGVFTGEAYDGCIWGGQLIESTYIYKNMSERKTTERESTTMTPSPQWEDGPLLLSIWAALVSP